MTAPRPGRRQTARALLLDLDGVLRRFDPEVEYDIERRSGLVEGSLAEAAFARQRLRPAILGEVDHDTWMAGVAADATLLSAAGPEAVRAAVDEWQAYRGEVVGEVLDFIRTARHNGIPVGIATNATLRLDDDLRSLSLVDEVDVVVNSSVLRRAKPAREFFAAACVAVGTPPPQCLFVDDDDRNVSAARVAGLSAHRWTGPADLIYLRAVLGLA